MAKTLKLIPILIILSILVIPLSTSFKGVIISSEGNIIYANLNGLNDTDVPSPTDGDVLYWNATSGSWKSKGVSGTGTVTSVTRGFGLDGIGTSITSSGTIAVNSTFLNQTIDARATGGGNASWNQTHANTLYSSIIYNYNSSTPDQAYTDTRITNLNTSLDIRFANVNGSADITDARISCLNITGGSDGDFCADATGGGGGNPFNQILNTSSNVTFGNIQTFGNNTYDIGNSTGYINEVYVNILQLLTQLTDAQVSDTLTSSNLVAGSEVVSDSEVEDNIAANLSKLIGLDHNTCSAGNFINNVTFQGGQLLITCDAPAGSGDITAVYTDPNTYLLGGLASGDANLTLNETKLNNTISHLGVNIGFNSTYNVSYHGSLNNASYLSTFNDTYKNLIGQQCPVGQVVNGTLINGTFTCITDATGGGASNPFNQILNTSSNVSHGNIVPATNDTYYLGNSTRYWNEVYVNILQVLTQLTDAQISNTLTSSDLVAGSSVVSNAEVDDDIAANFSKLIGVDDNACSSTDKATNVTINNGVLTITCSADLNSGADGTGGWLNDSLNTNTSRNVNIQNNANLSVSGTVNGANSTALESLQSNYGLWLLTSAFQSAFNINVTNYNSTLLTWFTFSGDSGSTSANTRTDTLTIAGGTNLATAVSGDTLTINTDANVQFTSANTTGNMTTLDRLCLNAGCTSYLYNNGTASIWA